jgi:hypothetical protein
MMAQLRVIFRQIALAMALYGTIDLAMFPPTLAGKDS